MRSHVLLSLTLITPCFLLLLCATPADAQCTANTIAFGKVGIVTGNPLRAEIVETSSDPSDTQKTVHELPPLSVARDSQGRVRTDRTVFTSNSTAASGTKVELHLILICDPVAQSTTQIDQLNATAKIMRSRDSSANSPAIQPRSLCSNQLHFKSTSNALVEDLGTQSIEGIEAHGVRITRKSRNDTAAGEESANVERVSELWCSDEVSALVLTSSEDKKNSVKTTVAMRNIERAEPDPALFKIQPGYTVSESVPDPIAHPTTNPQPNAQH